MIVSQIQSEVSFPEPYISGSGKILIAAVTLMQNIKLLAFSMPKAEKENVLTIIFNLVFHLYR